VLTPLVILLHGYTSSGQETEDYLKFTAEADARGFLYAHPDGTVDVLGHRFWNATDACCDLGKSHVDDSLYLSTVIDQIKVRYSVDPRRVFIVGHSNGAFMAQRMACDHADQIAAVVSVSGAMAADVSACKPQAPVSVLEIHGTADDVINYDGGMIQGHAYPSVATTVADWVSLNGCQNQADPSAAQLDLDSSLDGNETTVTKYAMGCKRGTEVELWTVTGGGHIPKISPTFAATVSGFLLSHPKIP
jgi:polyhydroxybutyrate depolymerase